MLPHSPLLQLSPLAQGMLTGRYLAGVCAGIGRATNTDPVLWRVLIVVLTLFGGVGLLVYLVGWLLTPAEGDTASPIEALIGRGESRTSPLIAVLVGFLAVITFLVVVQDSIYAAVLAATVLISALVLINRPRTPQQQPQAYAPAPYVPPPPQYPVHPAPVGAPGTQVTAMQPAGPPAAPPPGAPPPGTFRPPFAPHGPYGGPPPFPPQPPVRPQPRPPKPPKERSPLAQIVLLRATSAASLFSLPEDESHGPT